MLGLRWFCRQVLLLLTFATLLAAQAAHAVVTPSHSPLPIATSSEALPADFSFVDPYFEAVGDTESIGDSVITSLLQDRKGFLWIGTTKGLIQYDGYRFRRYAHNPRDPRTLVGEYILTLCLGEDGRIWIGTNSNGISVLNPDTERFEHFIHDDKKADSLSKGRIWGMAASSDGGVWVATDHGLDFIAKNSRQIQHFKREANNPHRLQSERLRSLFIDKNGDMWIGSVDGLQLLKKNSKVFSQFDKSSKIGAALHGKEIRSFLQTKDGKLWIGTRKHGAVRLDIASQETLWLPIDASSPDSLSHPWIKAMVAAPNNQIWMATVGGGINIVDASAGKVVRRLRRDLALPNSLAMDDLGALLIDRSGLLWIGTWGGGLQRHLLGNQAIRILRHSPSQPKSLSAADVRSILEIENGKILVGAYGNGIDIIDRKLGLIGGYRPAPAGNLPSGNILSLAMGADGSLWAGSQQMGLLRLAKGASTWQVWGLEQGMPGLQCRNLLVARNGDVWVGTTDGVARLPVGGKKFDTYSAADGTPMRNSAEALVEDQQGNIWIASGAGLWLWRNGSKVIVSAQHDAKRESSLASNDVRGVLVDKKNRVWVGTPQGLDKLLRWDDKQAEFAHIHAEMSSGMEPGENLLQDQQGRIWSDSFVYDPKQNRSIVLTKADGFDLGTPWLSSYARTQDGLFLYGGTNGVAIIDPQRYQPWSYQPPVVVSELRVNGKANTVSELAKDLVLTPERRSFSLEFAALDYSSPGKLHYSYRLLGYDRDWVETDANHRVASYGNLWPGRYMLQVRATNRLGQMSHHQLDIPVRVLPAFWQTGWFLACALLLIAGGVYVGYGWRLARMRAKERHLQAVVEARTADILNLAGIGRDLTSTLDIEQAFVRVYEHVRTRLDAHVFIIALIDDAQENLQLMYSMEGGQRQALNSLSMQERDRPAIFCVRERREVITKRLSDVLAYIDKILPPAMGEDMQTIVYIPLIVEQQVLGCLSVQSPTVDAYSPDQLEFLRVLVSYTAIAIANSGAHSKLSTAHDQLAQAHQHLQETQNKLIHSEKMASLGGLVAGIAHEINTPLGTTLVAISGASHALRSLQSEVAAGRLLKTQFEEQINDCIDYASLAFRTANRAASLVETFKLIAVSSADDDAIDFDLSLFLRELMVAAYKNLQAPGCDYVLDVPPFLPVHLVQTDLQEAMIRVLDNVLVHAFSGGRTGTLNVSARIDEHDKICLQVQDNGHGIAAEHLPHIFDPFFTTKGGDQGHVGLGLHVAYNHVTQGLHGEISVASTFDQGCCVTLRFGRGVTGDAL